MKSLDKKAPSVHAARWAIVAAILAGTLLISGIAELSEGTGTMTRLFFLFLGAVIVVQVIPGVMLLGAMLKGICTLFAKKAKVAVRKDAK